MGLPISAPRQTRADVWQKRPAVMRARAWADECRLACTGSTTTRVEADVLGVVAFFHFPVPKSLETKNLWGKVYRQKPDADNLCKLVLDSLLAEDKRVVFVQGFKLYVEEGAEARTDVYLIVQ